jgi:ABC-2 type transport system permease protein
MTDALRQIGALARRDLQVEWSYPIQPIVRFLSLLTVTTSLFFVGKLVYGSPALARYGGHYFEFVMLGFLLGWFASNGLASFGKSIGDDLRSGTLESLLTSPMGIPAWVVGSLVVPFGFMVVQIVVYLAVGIVLFNARFDLSGTLLAAPFLLLGIVSFGALAVMSGAFILLTKRGDPITTLLAQGVTYFSGGLFPTSLLPGPLEALTRAVPAYWALEGLRRALLAKAGWVDLRGELVMLTVLTAVLVPVALASFRWAVRVGRRTATLSTY